MKLKTDGVSGVPTINGPYSNPVGVDVEGNVHFMETKPTDDELAQSLRDQLAGPLKEICRLRDLARSHGLSADFNFPVDQFGRSIIPHVMITKAL